MSIQIDASKGIKQNTTEVTKIPVGTTAQRPANPAAGMIRFNTDQGFVEWYDDFDDDWLPTSEPPAVIATGGTVTDIELDSELFRVHTFTSDGTFDVTRGGDVEYLVVAGGGGGAFGGGGAGEVKFGRDNVSVSTISVTVGAGGLFDANGGDSQFGSIVSNGGFPPTPGRPYLGGDEGSGTFVGGTGKSDTYAKGGAGAGAGGDGFMTNTSSPIANSRDTYSSGGVGGNGVYYGGFFGEQYGENGWFGGGGGGYGYKASEFTDGSYLGGLGGGGDGYIGFTGTPRARGMANTGGGGPGGVEGAESVGGSGIVIVRYRIG